VNAIRDNLAASPLQDEMTQALRQWQQEFSIALRLNVDVDRIEKEFVTLLQELLKDPIYHAPLDEEPLLGSDGKTYGRKSLCIHLHSIPDNYRHRSPFAPHDPTAFTTMSHPIAQEMVLWLKCRGELLSCVKIEQSFQTLVEENQLPSVPTKQSERIQRLKDKQMQRNREKAEKRDAFAAQINAMRDAIAQNICETFAPIHQKAEKVAQEQLKKIDIIEKKDYEQHQALLKVVNQLESDVKALELQNEELRNRIQNVDTAISEAERDNVRLQIAINETRKAIQERDQGSISSLVTALAIIGACAFATWATQSVLLSTGASGNLTVMPLPNGALGSLSFAL
jgi:hypothetical protein